MREVLFRGKHIHTLPQNKHLDGTWVYGYLCDENHINAVDEDEYGGKFTSEMLIDPLTVCQYTGLTDKNGRKIFEGDIVSGLFAGERITGYIRYGSNAEFYVERNGLYGIHLDNSKDWLDVIGNIFDNPELIGE